MYCVPMSARICAVETVVREEAQRARRAQVSWFLRFDMSCRPSGAADACRSCQRYIRASVRSWNLAQSSGLAAGFDVASVRGGLAERVAATFFLSAVCASRHERVRDRRAANALSGVSFSRFAWRLDRGGGSGAAAAKLGSQGMP